MAYFILLAIAALDSAGYSIIAPVVPEIGEETGAGPGIIGALVGCFAVGQLVGYPLGGRGIRRQHAVSVLGVSFALIIIGDAAFVLGDSLAVYFPARLLQGIGAGALWMGLSFAIIERFPGQEYRRLTGVLAAYGVGAIAGPAMGGVGGIRTPFLIHLCVTVVLAIALVGIGAPRERRDFGSGRVRLRSPGFWLASAGILLVALALGTLDGPLPLHFAERLDQAEIAALYVAAAIIGGISATLAGRLSPRPTLVAATVLLPCAIALAGLVDSVPLWLVAVGAAGIGLGIGEAGALGILLDTVGTERIVAAMVVWSQVWALGYLAGPTGAGWVADAFGFAAIGLVPLAAALLVCGALLFPAMPGRPRSGASRA